AQATTCKSAHVEKGVEALVARLSAAAGPELGPIQVVVLDDSTVNAFALPGGHVFVLSGLLKSAESTEEVAAVLAHELGHVARRHHVRNAIRELGVVTAFSLLLGDVDGVTAMILGQARDLSSLA